MRQFQTLTAFFITLLALFACSDYSLIINDQRVYDPPGIFTNFRVSDMGLQRCIDQTIKEGSLTATKQVLKLQCPQKDISSLEGIELFNELRILGLEGNKLKSIDNLQALEQLEQLNLADNQLVDVAVLHRLTQLQYLNLGGNNELDCSQLKAINTDKMILPEHCL